MKWNKQSIGPSAGLKGVYMKNMFVRTKTMSCPFSWAYNCRFQVCVCFSMPLVDTPSCPHRALGQSSSPQTPQSQRGTRQSSFLNHVKAVAGPENVRVTAFTVPSFYDAYLVFFNTTGQVGGTTELISRLVSTKLAKEQPGKITQVALGIKDGIEFK
jgi:hypothetical protein